MIKLLLIIITLLMSPSFVFAESSATVKVNNNIQTSSNLTVNSKTNITVETNRKTTTYSSDGAENVELKSVNGESEIKVNGIVVDVSPTNTKEPTGSSSLTPTNEKKEENKKNIIGIFEDLLKKVFFFFD